MADPEWSMDTAAYAVLLANGFRRSGDLVYRPGCEQCSACIPVRVPVSTFSPTRNQRRTLKANSDLECRVVPPTSSEEVVSLYAQYLGARHRDSDMASGDPSDLLSFLTSAWSQTVFVELRAENRLVAVAVTDQTHDALSAVYTFFDPNCARRSLGRLSILLQLQIAKARDAKWLYLGYAIGACRNMAYKTEYMPQQHFVDGVWRDMTRHS